MDGAPNQLTVRIFNPDGTLLASLLPRSALGNSKDVSHLTSSHGASAILPTPDGAAVIAPSAARLALINLEPANASVVTLQPGAVPDASMGDAVATSNGRLFAIFYPLSTGASAGSPPSLAEIQTTGAVVPLIHFSHLARDANRLLGSDGPQLVLRTGCCRLEWLDPPAALAASK